MMVRCAQTFDNVVYQFAKQWCLNSMGDIVFCFLQEEQSVPKTTAFKQQKSTVALLMNHSGYETNKLDHTILESMIKAPLLSTYKGVLSSLCTSADLQFPMMVCNKFIEGMPSIQNFTVDDFRQWNIFPNKVP